MIEPSIPSRLSQDQETEHVRIHQLQGTTKVISKRHNVKLDNLMKSTSVLLASKLKQKS